MLIDRQLADAGWSVQDKKDLNLYASQGVACREVVMKQGHGRADYLLYVDQKVVGVIEAKPAGTSLSGVEWQSAMYAEGLPAAVRLQALTVEGRLPFVFEASGTETHFTNGYDPDARARRVFNVPKPQTLAKIVRDVDADPDRPTWRAKVRSLPELDTTALRPAQITAINGIENSLSHQHFDRSLVQMATGAGKTFTAGWRRTVSSDLFSVGPFHARSTTPRPLPPTPSCALATIPIGRHRATPGTRKRRARRTPAEGWTNGSLMRLRVGDAGRCEGAAKRVFPR